MTNQDASQQLKNELQNIIYRYSQESDVTIAEAIGVLELVKIELIDEAMCDDGDDNEADESEGA